MRELLKSLVVTIRGGLPYLSWVGVLDDELLPPEEPAPPFAGVRDGGIVATSLPGGHDIEVLTVHVVAYQALFLDEPGAAIIGNAELLGAAGKGLLEISADLKALLTDNFLGQAKVHFAWRSQVERTEVLRTTNRLLSMQRNMFLYRRYV